MRVRRLIGESLPLPQRLQCQLLIAKGGFDLGELAALRTDKPTSAAGKALRVRQGQAVSLPRWWQSELEWQD